jgi:DNA-binding transcriptional LysR family regulator
LRADKVDLAFVWPPICDGSGILLEPLVCEETVIVLPTSHRLSGFKSLPLAALASEVFVMYPRELNPGNYDSIMKACHASGFKPLLGQEAPQIVSVIPLVAAGLGISIVPRSTSRMMLSDHVRFIAIEGRAPHGEIHLARRRRDNSQSLKDFVLIARRLVKAKAMRRNEGPSNSQASAFLG